MIELGKQYRLANGREFRLYAVDGGDHYVVHGAYFHPNGHWQPDRWTAEGKSRPMGEGFDLVEVRPRHKRTVWINMYPGGGASMHLSRELADDYGFKRHSCIEHTFDFEEGEGL